MKVHSKKNTVTAFKTPDDKDLFLARDAQKQKRIEAKEKSKNLKIWDKKTATSRLPLKRFRDADLPPSDAGKQVIVFNNPSDKDIIDAAKNICKERVQFPKDHRSQNAYEFIEQKKEMFLVQLSHNTIKKEIDALETKIERKVKALDQSKKLLNQDEKDVRNYVEHNNENTKKIERDAEEKMKERKELEEQLKNTEAEITALNYQSSKNNQDTLETLEAHKKFLEELSDADFLKENREKQEKEIKALKKDWISKQLAESKSKGIFTQEAAKKSGKKDERIRMTTITPDMSDEEMDKRFQYCLSNFLVDVPKNFYHEEIQFKDPDEISQKFNDLEEKNLFLIHARQEIEQSLEELRKEDKKIRKELTERKLNYQKKLEILEENEKNYYENIGAKVAGFGAHPKGAKEEDDEDVSVLLERLRSKIEVVCKKTKAEKIDLTAKGTIDMLSEIEIALDNRIHDLLEYRYTDEAEVKRAEGNIKNKRKERNIKETNDKKFREEREKKKRADEANEKIEGNYFKGRKAMYRSKKKSIVMKRDEPKVDPQVEERKRYIGGMF